MHRFIIAVLTIVSFAAHTEGAHTDIPPREDFPSGAFLGEGSFISTYGPRGTYSSFATIDDNFWAASYVREGQLTNYEASFAFVNDGEFFTVVLTQYGAGRRETLHNGVGYCIDDVCHITADLSHGRLEETVSFNRGDNVIKRIGSLRFKDANGKGQAIAWKENMVRIYNGDDLQ